MTRRQKRIYLATTNKVRKYLDNVKSPMLTQRVVCRYQKDPKKFKKTPYFLLKRIERRRNRIKFIYLLLKVNL